MILLTIAFRNLREHKVKTLIIGSLIAIGIAFLVVGNSVMESVTDGMRQSYVTNFTGELIIRGATEEEISFIGGFGGAPPPLENYTRITEYLDREPGIAAYTPMLTGTASINKDDQTLSFALLWGIQPSSYRAMFEGRFELVEGEYLKDGEEGIMLSKATIDEISEEYGVALEPGDTILLSGRNNITGTKIREVTLRGVGTFANSVGLLDRISFVDVTTLRSLTGLTSVQIDRSGETEAAPISEDDLFGDSSMFGDALVRETETNAETLDLENILGDVSVREQFLSLDNNAWNYLLLELEDGFSEASVQRSIERGGLGDGFSVENWRWGAGFIANLAFGVRNILNIVILVIAVVAVIIIMNTLVISVTERFAEIGTIRAIGGQKFFVRRMITAEVLMITIVFGVIGMALGCAIIAVLNVAGLPASGLFMQILFGGPELKPLLSVGSLFSSIVIVAVIGVVASLYPVSVALGITPVQAMQRQ